MTEAAFPARREPCPVCGADTIAADAGGSTLRGEAASDWSGTLQLLPDETLRERSVDDFLQRTPGTAHKPHECTGTLW